MKLYTFEVSGHRCVGAEYRGQLVDLKATHSAMIAARKLSPGLRAAMPTDLLAFLRAGAPAMEAAREALAFLARRPAVPADVILTYPMDAVKIDAPVRPGKILCSGVNYRSHCDENPGAKLPTEPFFFSKLPTAVIGPGQPIVHPKLTQQLDYEVEFAVVIGRKMKRTPESDVLAHIAGYTILHDVSARDVQFKDNQITLGKNFDTFCPLGPCIVTTDELTEPGRVRLRTLLNGQVMQDGSTGDWLFSLPRLLGALSNVMTLEPGDVVSTGTPAGVGVFRRPPVFMKPGDRVRLEIDGIGALENPVVAEA